jgi:D-sedoheptulose 7-phosphate isomerase
MDDEITDIFLEGARLRERCATELPPVIRQIADLCVRSLRAGGKVAFCGNGGSAADAQHLAGELVGRFLLERPGFASLALTTDTSILTGMGNDYGFDEVFVRQVEGLLRAGDVLIAISTSGTARNCLRAVEVARAQGVRTVAFTGGKGGPLGPACDVWLAVPHDVTARVQEIHITAGHILCGLVEAALVADPGASRG